MSSIRSCRASLNKVGNQLGSAVAAAMVFSACAHGPQASSAAVEPGSGLVVQTSAQSFDATVAAAEQAIESKGLTLAAALDHTENAKSAGLRLAPTTLLIFGNPEAGTPLMQNEQSIGIDLPMKLLVWEDASGTVRLAYNAPEYLAARHGIAGAQKRLEKIAGVLQDIADAAARSAATTTAQ